MHTFIQLMQIQYQCDKRFSLVLPDLIKNLSDEPIFEIIQYRELHKKIRSKVYFLKLFRPKKNTCTALRHTVKNYFLYSFKVFFSKMKKSVFITYFEKPFSEKLF